VDLTSTAMPYSIIYASLVTLAFVAASGYALGRAHDARHRAEAFRLGWRVGLDSAEEFDLRRRLAQTRVEEKPRPVGQNRSAAHQRLAMPINERRPAPRRVPRVPIEDAETMDLAGRRL
jgi:hypothetical protein